MKREKKNKEADTTPKKKRGNYEAKLKIEGTLDDVLKVLVCNPAIDLKKRKGNKKTK